MNRMFNLIPIFHSTCVNSRENGQRDEECEENIEALRETGLEHIPVRDGVDHIAFALLLKGLVVHVVVVAEKSLKKRRKKYYSEISILLNLDFIDNLGFIECPLKPIVNK